MSHDLDTINGQVAFASVRESAWHGLGQILPDYLDTDDMLREAKLDWNVEAQPIFTKDGIEIPNARATVRDIDGKPLGIVGDRYTVIQNRETFEIGQSIIGGEAKWETAGAINGGRRIFVLAKLNQEMYIAGDKLDPYFLLENSHDGTKAMRLVITPVRVVCQNTLNLALRTANRTIALRHTPNYEARLAEARKSLGLVKKYYETFEQQAEKLVNQLFSRAQFDGMLEVLVPSNNEGSKAEKNHIEEKREAILQCWNADDIANVRNTAWGAYNAIADFSDHHAKTRGLQDREQREKLFTRSFEDVSLKDKALDYILAVA